MMNSERISTKGNKKQREIVEATIKLINLVGIENISASKISEITGISKSSIFYHYDSLESIKVIVLERLMQQLIDLVDLNSHSTLEEFLLNLATPVSTQLDWNNAIMSYYCESIFNPVYKDIVKKYLDIYKAKISSQLKRYLPEESIGNMSILITATLDGLFLHTAFEEPNKIDEVWKLQVKNIISTIEREIK